MLLHHMFLHFVGIFPIFKHQQQQQQQQQATGNRQQATTKYIPFVELSHKCKGYQWAAKNARFSEWRVPTSHDRSQNHKQNCCWYTGCNSIGTGSWFILYIYIFVKYRVYRGYRYIIPLQLFLVVAPMVRLRASYSHKDVDARAGQRRSPEVPFWRIFCLSSTGLLGAKPRETIPSNPKGIVTIAYSILIFL